MIFQNSFEFLIAAYLFLAGVGAGAILSAALLDIVDRKKYLSYIKSASVIGAPMVIIGCIFLYFDLGQAVTKPWLLIYLFANPMSAISWGTGILSLFIIFALVYAAYNFGYISFGGAKWIKVLLVLLAIGTAGYTAVLLGVLKAIPFWHQTLLPLLFLVSAVSSGMAASIIIELLFFGEGYEIVDMFHLYLLIMEFIAIAGMLLVSLAGVPEMAYSAKTLLSGAFALEFWLLLIFLGMLLPLVMHTLNYKGIFHMGVKTHVTVELCVLVGGFYLRYLIIHAGVYTQKFIDYSGL